MRRQILAFLSLVLLAPCAGAQEAATATPPAAAPDAAPPVHVVLATPLGDITLELDAQRAPITTANFLRYVDQKRFDGTTFYRAVKVDEEGNYGLVQGGVRGDPKRKLKPILHEAPYATGLGHVEGAISMAREEPGSATGDWFIVVGDLRSLDGDLAKGDHGYAVFGRVSQGMDLVKQLLLAPRDPEAGVAEGMKGQMLASPVKISSARRAQ